MDIKISPKVQKKIENIINIKSQLKNWKNLSISEVSKLVKEFEKTPRDEGSSFYNEHFTDIKFADLLLEIADAFANDSKLTTNIVSSLGMMMWRYKLPESDKIYSFMVENSQRKEVGAFVSMYLPKMMKFKEYSNKWEYFLNIKSLTPKNIAESEFIEIIKEKVNDIPIEFKHEIIKFLEDKIETSKSDYSRNEFIELIKKID